MKTIEIKIPELGKHVGTLAWVAEKLESFQKNIKLSESHPTVLINNKVVAWVGMDAREEYDECYQHQGQIRYLFPNQNDSGFSDSLLGEIPLTEKAYEKVNDFLKEIAIQLEARWIEG